MSASCTVELSDTQPEPALPPEQQFELDTQQLLVVRLNATLEENAGLRQRENEGLALALLESGLAEIQHVLPGVEGATTSPGLTSWNLDNAIPWRAKVWTEENNNRISVRVELCDPIGVCNEHVVAAPMVELPQAMAPILQAMAQQMGRPPLAGAKETWDAPLSSDAYALRVAGRAAASIYGLLPPVAPAFVGDRKRDPVTRAVFLDPSLSLAQWLAGRRELSAARATNAREFFTRAVLEGKRRVLFRADEAAATMSEGHDAEAVKAWEQLRREVPEDVRFIPGHADALLRSRSLKQASVLLDALPSRYQRSLTVIPLRAKLAELGVGPEDYDALLFEWESLAPKIPEPRLRRIQLRVRQGKLPEALTLAQGLGERGGTDEAARLGMALAVGTGDWAFAEQQAQLAHLPRVTASIRARAALESSAAVIPPELVGAGDSASLLARGEAYIAMNRFASALGEANRLLEQLPWMPEALALRARAEWGLGRSVEAQRTEARLRFADPGWSIESALPPYGAVPGESPLPSQGAVPAGPSTVPGNTRLGSQRQVSPP